MLVKHSFLNVGYAIWKTVFFYHFLNKNKDKDNSHMTFLVRSWLIESRLTDKNKYVV